MFRSGGRNRMQRSDSNEQTMVTWKTAGPIGGVKSSRRRVVPSMIGVRAPQVPYFKTNLVSHARLGVVESRIRAARRH
jgi:hypothetical protein